MSPVNIHNYKAIIYDWDGTLVDSTDWVVGAHNHVRTSFNLSPWTKDDIFSSSSQSSRELYPKIYGDKSDEALKVLFTYIAEHNLKGAIPYQGAAELLEMIQKNNIAQGVVSNKGHDPLVKVVQHLNWQNYFSAVVGAGYCKKDKPDAAPLLKAISLISPDLSPAEVLYVGDSETDLLCATNTGCDAVLIQSERARPDLIAKYNPAYVFDKLEHMI